MNYKILFCDLTLKFRKMEKEDNSMKTPKMMRMVFGIFMVLIYVGMGILLFMNFFEYPEQYAWIRWLVGSMLVLYGFWRAYRQYKGIDTRM